MTGLAFPVDALVSYFYMREDKDMAAAAAAVATGRLSLIGDSGAFSAHTRGVKIRLGEYAEWIQRWRKHLVWVASLDVIGHAGDSWRNWNVLRDRHGLDTVPTVHAGARTDTLDAYAAAGATLIGLGGMAGRGYAQRAFRWALSMFRYARDRWPAVRFHLWGVTRRQYLDALPVWSADSSGLLGQPYRYGWLPLFNPASGQHVYLALRGEGDVYRHTHLLRVVYGVDPATIDRAGVDNRQALIQLTAASTQAFAAWLQRRHQVTPPALLATDQVGTRIHLAESSPKDLLAVVAGRQAAAR